MRFSQVFFILLSFGLLQASQAEERAQCESKFRNQIVTRIKMLYPKGTRVEIEQLNMNRSGDDKSDEINWCGIDLSSITFVYGPVAGRAAYAYKSGEQDSRHCVVSHKAYRKGFVSKRRYRPGEVLTQQDFEAREIDVAQFLPFEAKQEYLDQPLQDGAYEAYATILEGRPLLASQVKAAPKFRKGDRVRLEIISGGVHLETSGVAQEIGYVAQPLRVRMHSNLKEVTGVVTPDGRVKIEL